MLAQLIKTGTVFLQSSVGRYPMHSLNSGFTGLKVPIKDQMVRYVSSPRMTEL